MLTIDNNGNLKFNRGETFEVPLFIDIGDNIFKSTRFRFHLGDRIFFHILEGNAPFERPLLDKKFTYEDTNENNDIIIKFEHKDTDWIFPGTYYYQVMLLRLSNTEDEEDEYITLTPRRKMIIQ